MARLERFASDTALMERVRRFESDLAVMLWTRQAEKGCWRGSQSLQRQCRYSAGQGQSSIPCVAGRSGRVEVLGWSNLFRIYIMISINQPTAKLLRPRTACYMTPKQALVNGANCNPKNFV